jgi:hypothetical protein
MSVRTQMYTGTIDRSGPDRASFPLHKGYRRPPAANAVPAAAADIDTEEQWPPDEIPTSAGCLRGFCWAMGIESTVTLCAYGLWRLWSLLS